MLSEGVPEGATAHVSLTLGQDSDELTAVRQGREHIEQSGHTIIINFTVYHGQGRRVVWWRCRNCDARALTEDE